MFHTLRWTLGWARSFLGFDKDSHFSEYWILGQCAFPGLRSEPKFHMVVTDVFWPLSNDSFVSWSAVSLAVQVWCSVLAHAPLERRCVQKESVDDFSLSLVLPNFDKKKKKSSSFVLSPTGKVTLSHLSVKEFVELSLSGFFFFWSICKVFLASCWISRVFM